jgi:hypothetical protein
MGVQATKTWVCSRGLKGEIPLSLRLQGPCASRDIATPILQQDLLKRQGIVEFKHEHR